MPKTTSTVITLEPAFAHVDDKKNYSSYWVKWGTLADGTGVTAAYEFPVVYIGSLQDAQVKYPNAKEIS
jgi:hypothetical protein